MLIELPMINRKHSPLSTLWDRFDEPHEKLTQEVSNQMDSLRGTR
jgi:hypothetical protein